MPATDLAYVYRQLEYIRRLRCPASRCNSLRKWGKRCVAGKNRQLVGERSKWLAGPFQGWLGMHRSQDRPVDLSQGACWDRNIERVGLYVASGIFLLLVFHCICWSKQPLSKEPCL